MLTQTKCIFTEAHISIAAPGSELCFCRIAMAHSSNSRDGKSLENLRKRPLEPEGLESSVKADPARYQQREQFDYLATHALSKTMPG